MIVMSYAIPIIFLFVLNSFSSGLTYYYFLSNIITVAQQLSIRKFVDDSDVRAKLEQYQKQNVDKKPGGFQARLADMMKAQAELAKQQNENKRK